MLSRWSSNDVFAELANLNFGNELHDIKAIEKYISNTIQFTTDIREFIKERADIEKEYGRKLDSLVAKYSNNNNRKDKQRNNADKTNFGSIRDSMIISEATAESFAGNASIQNIWARLLQEMDTVAKSKLQVADQLLTDTAERLRLLTLKKEDANKKQLAFVQRILSEREKLTQEMIQRKQDYLVACDVVQMSKQKMRRSVDSKSLEKLKKQQHQDILEMNNRKNLYLLSIDVANKSKAKYHQIDIPKFLLDMHQFGQTVVNGIKSIWNDYFGLEKDNLYSPSLDSALRIVNMVDGCRDVDLFLAKVGVVVDGEEIIQPLDFTFEPCTLWKDSPQFVTDDYSCVYMRNLKKRLTEQTTSLTAEINFKIKELESARKLYDIYSSGQAKGDLDAVDRSILELLNEITLFNYKKLKLDSQINMIDKNITPDYDERPHNFKPNLFTIPTTCDFCLQNLWGVSKPGLTCKECGCNVHTKCELKVAAACSDSRGTATNKPTSSCTPATTTTTTTPLTTTAQIQHTTNVSNAGRSNRRKPSLNSVSMPKMSSSCSDPDFAHKTTQEALQPVRAKVLYDYIATTPDTEHHHQEDGTTSLVEDDDDVELTVKEGDIVQVVFHEGGNGWSIVKNASGKKGLVPTSYILEFPNNSSCNVLLPSSSPTSPKSTATDLLKVPLMSHSHHHLFQKKDSLLQQDDTDDNNLLHPHHRACNYASDDDDDDDNNSTTMFKEDEVFFDAYENEDQHNTPTTKVLPDNSNGQHSDLLAFALETQLNDHLQQHGKMDDTVVMPSKATVLFDYVGSCKDEISAKQGDCLEVLEKDSGDGWITVSNNNGKSVGLFPASYVETNSTEKQL